jgi:hypothetical protein
VNSATYVTGTTGSSTGRGVAVDAAGNEFVTGTRVETSGNTFAFVAKYDTSSNQVYLYALYFTADGAIDPTEGHGIAVDSSGNLYLVGTFQQRNGITWSYVAKTTNDFTMFLGTAYFGRTAGLNSLDGVALDQAGHVIATGVSSPNGGAAEVFYADLNSSNFSVVGAHAYDFSGQGFQASSGAGVGVQPDGSHLAIAGTLVPFSGSLNELLLRVTNPATGEATMAAVSSEDGDAVGTAAAVDAAGNDYFAGTLAVPGGTVADVQKFAPGSGLTAPPVWEYQSADTTSTVNALALGTGGTIYITGSAQDAGGNPRVLITQLLDTGDDVQEAGTARVGGTGPSDVGMAVAVDLAGNAVVVGTTTSPDFPVTDGSTLNGTSDAFLLNYGF